MRRADSSGVGDGADMSKSFVGVHAYLRDVDVADTDIGDMSPFRPEYGDSADEDEDDAADAAAAAADIADDDSDGTSELIVFPLFFVILFVN